MADVRLRIKSEILPIRVESAKLILPDTVGAKVENMYLTEEGTLRSVWGPAPYVPNYGSGYPTYTSMKGLYHTRIGHDGERDVLLLQDGDDIKVFEGWDIPADPWQVLVSPTGSPDLVLDVKSDDKPRFPAQFESTPDGVVIIPSGDASLPLFYDGRTILPLGYSTSPPPPAGLSPEEPDGDDWYKHTAISMEEAITPGTTAATSAGELGVCRVGSVSLDGIDSSISGRIAKGSYRAATQWMDLWGNLSPLSGRSGPVRIPASDPSTATQADDRLYQTLWTGIQSGPDGTVGRILCRTMDELNSGTAKLFEMPAYASDGFLSPVSIPDNVSFAFPDNVPDSWLVREPEKPVAVTPFKVYTLAFGRGWAANFDGDGGKLHPSMPGRWGTFLENEEIYPDPRGNQITGLCQVAEGLLVFTDITTFLIVPSYGGEGFQARTIHPSVGCVAPSSIGMLPDGTAMWLGREGFYGYRGEQIQLLSDGISKEVRAFNRARVIQSTAAVDVRERKYRCWVPMNGSKENNTCWEYDGEGWTRRNDVSAAAVCVTQDHRSYMLAAGKAHEEGVANPASGVWVLDHQVQSFDPTPRAAMVQTSWLRAPFSERRGSPLSVYLWFRETDSGSITVEVERDWRAEVVQTETATLHPTDDIPPFWGTTLLGSSSTWKERRPYWTRVDVYVPSAEVFRLKITYKRQVGVGVPFKSGHWEFIGLAFDEAPKGDTFRSAPK